jgi:hypothetical protein
MMILVMMIFELHGNQLRYMNIHEHINDDIGNDDIRDPWPPTAIREHMRWVSDRGEHMYVQYTEAEESMGIHVNVDDDDDLCMYQTEENMCVCVCVCMCLCQQRGKYRAEESTCIHVFG